MNDGLDRTRDLVLSSGNATRSAEDRSAIAREVSQTVDTLLSLANTRASSGEFVFAGTAGDRKAIEKNETTGTWSFQGATNVRELPVSDSQIASLGTTANTLFFNGSHNFFGQMDKLVDTLNKNPLAESELEQIIVESLDSIDSAQHAVNTSLTSIGAQMNALDTAEEINTDLQLGNQSLQSTLEDLDYIGAITQLTLEQTALTAAQKSFASASKMSLFNYI
jgi:flagellar hook-associated protein 3 FlgL